MKRYQAHEGTVALDRPRVLDFLTLTKPELTLLSMLTAVAGFLLGGAVQGKGVQLLALIAGTGLIGGGAGALNQLAERSYDALMHRTSRRPLPAGRLTPSTVLTFGLACSAAGLMVLARYTGLLTASLGGITLASYLFLYTPLKRVTPLATYVGAIPGALPPVMGWTAFGGGLDLPALCLFGLLFLWQIPHFFSLAWMYRKDYARAGFRMLTVIDETGLRTARQSLVALVALLPVSFMLASAGELGPFYLTGAAIAGVAFLASGIRFLVSRTAETARLMFFASLLYFPLVFLFLILDRAF
jgi:heme o synthase